MRYPPPPKKTRLPLKRNFNCLTHTHQRHHPIVASSAQCTLLNNIWCHQSICAHNTPSVSNAARPTVFTEAEGDEVQSSNSVKVRRICPLQTVIAPDHETLPDQLMARFQMKSSAPTGDSEVPSLTDASVPAPVMHPPLPLLSPGLCLCPGPLSHLQPPSQLRPLSQSLQLVCRNGDRFVASATPLLQLRPLCRYCNRVVAIMTL